MRDDSVLNTGASSASFGSTKAQKVLEAKKQDRSRDTKEVKNTIKPSVKPISEIVQKEIDGMWDIRTFTEKHMESEISIRDEIRARQIAEVKLASIKSQIENIQRVK